MSIVTPDASSLCDAADALRAGQLVALPTETVYGLGADALNPAAVRAIFAAKGRPADHPLIVHLPDAEHMTRWASAIPKEALALARAFWPGPLTLILKRDSGVPDEVTGGQDTVGLRVPNHPVALALLRAFDSGIAAPSANRFGRISPTTAQHVADELGDKVAIILDGGACEVGIESTILDLSRDSPVILRPGAISADAIAAIIGRRPGEGRDTPSSVAPRVSGALAAHYAPRTPLEIVPSGELRERAVTAARKDTPIAVIARTADEPTGLPIRWLHAPNDPAGYAHDLYANLRELDAIGASLILVEAVSPDQAWQAVADRLGRAATGSGEQDET